jgi:hypothetical protein
MPVFHFVLRAYGTWHPDHLSGWNQHGDPYRRRADIPLGRYRRKTQRWESVEFASEMRRPLLDMAREVCRRRVWRCHTAAVTATHIHIVTSWRDAPLIVDQVTESFVQDTLKRLLGLTAAKLSGIKGRRWFSDGGKPKRVRDLAHLHWLITEYLPQQGGIFWSEAWKPETL